MRIRRRADRPRRLALDVGWEVPEDEEPTEVPDPTELGTKDQLDRPPSDE
jgi:hypothetical protein